jgi:hypothetical protein
MMSKIVTQLTTMPLGRENSTRYTFPDLVQLPCDHSIDTDGLFRSVAAAICQSLADATTKVGPALITQCQ